MKNRFLRFVATKRNGKSGQSSGLFSIAYGLLQDGMLSYVETVILREELAWFEKNLPVPKPDYITGRHIFWYKAEAQECLQRMWRLANVLKSFGYLVELKRCWWPGHVIYEDEFQVIASPYRR